jgi:hypothetical protein
MADQGRRSFLKRLGLTFAAFEASVMKEVGVASPTSLTAIPKQVYAIMGATVENHDEGWGETDGSTLFRLFINKELADAEAGRLNRAFLRSSELCGMSEYEVENLNRCEGISKADWKIFTAEVRKYLPDLGRSEKTLVGNLQEYVGDSSNVMFAEDTPDAFLDKFLDYLHVPGLVHVQEYNSADLDPELLKKLELPPPPPATPHPDPSGTPAATAPA